MKKRILSILLICCMVLTMLPATALAEESGQTGGVTASGLCEHHPAHDDECGYTEGTAGTPCSHEHTEDCYPQNSVSGNNATSSNADEPTECTHVCSEESGCITKQLNCQHEHDEDCGYTPATAGTPCGYVCEICGAEGNVAKAMTVERVQAMIDALPDAEEITKDNGEEVIAQLEAIDEAKAELTDEEIDELDITRYMAAAAALGSLAAPMLLANAAPAEQFNLTPGGTYWFDLSGENIPGTVNTGTSDGAVSVPDTTLHYVPFTYAGTVDAYVLNSSSSEQMGAAEAASQTTDESGQYGYTYPHSLFVADYAVTHTVEWDELNTAGLIFGKSYTGGSVDYTLRAPSVGSWHTGSYDLGTPQSNEWDVVLDKNSGYIKNWNGIYSWGQDTTRYNSLYRGLCGYNSAHYWSYDYATTSRYVRIGFRPVLEVLNTDTLGSDGLKAVTLDLNGGKLGGSADNIQIIVKNGAAFTAPASHGLTAPTGYNATGFKWQDSDGNLYAPGDSVPAGVTTLTAQWTPDTYTVTLHLNDGTIANDKNVTEYTYGTGATLPTADDITRAGHTFEGWYEDENFSGSPVTKISATDTGKKEFYAKWEQKANAGLFVDAVPEKTYGDPAFTLNVHADSDGKVTYSSDNEDTATVDKNGTVTIHQVGTATLTIRIAETAKYLPGEVTVTITVVRKNATLTVDKLTYNVTYGDADFIIGYASEGESSVTFASSNEKVATVDKNGVVHIVSAGSATITLNMKQSGNYNAVSKKVEVIVAPKVITVTAHNQTKTYGGDDPKLTYTADGLVNGDTLTGIALTREAGTNVGQYDITLSQQTGANPNYSITFVKGALTIQPLGAQLSWSNTNLTYNGKVQKPTAAMSNLLPGDTCTVTVTGGQTDAGSYTATATALSNGNYTLPANVTADFSIAPKDITVMITPNGGVYAGTITPAAAELTGVCDGDTVEVTLTYTGTANDGTVVNSTDTPTLAGTYTVTATIADSNYNLTGTNTAEFVVVKANAGLSVGTVPEKTYGDAAFKLDVHADSDGKVTYSSDNEDTATVDENGIVTLHNVGTATLTAEVAETANYEGGKVTVTVTVVRKNATLTVDKLTYNVTYGDADFIIDYVSEGESSVTFTSSNEKVATVDKNGVVHIVSAGSATITLNMEQSGNYNAVSKKVEVIVAPKAITVTAHNQTKIYDEDDPELTYTAVSLVGEDTLTGITLTRADGENAGEYDITASQADGANPNYDITFKSGTLTIAARDIADAEVELGVALIANGKTQEQNIKRVKVKNAKGQELEVTYTVTGNQATEPGAYTMTITGTGNFTGTVTKTFVIAPAANSKVDTNESGDVVIGKGTISVEVVQETGASEAEIRTGKAAIIEMLVANGDLTAEELSQVGDGASIRVLLNVTVASTTITEESKAQIEKAAEDYVIGQYIDISLFKQTICNGQAEGLIRLTGTYEEMEISLVVPENLPNRDNSVTRTFWIIRNHDGKVEFLPATYDAQTNTLTFKTDKFSDYAIVYKDAKKAAENPAKPDNTATGTSPQTGDPVILWIWFVLLFISCGGVITTIYIGKRKKDKAE